MKDFIDDYIVTLSGKRLTSIHELLSSARVSKSDLDVIVEKLKDYKKDSPLVLNKEGFGSLINSNTFDIAHRDGLRRLQELFNVSNNISLILDSYKDVLVSEIKSLEDDLVAIEKAVENYGFMLSDGGFFDYAFIETFNDETIMEKDISNMNSDRSGVPFAQEDLAIVNGNAGILSLSPSLSSSYPLKGFVSNNNCLGLATSSSGLDMALNDAVGNGWRVALSSVRPLSSKLYSDLTETGAQVELELHLSAPAPSDTIVLYPFSDIPLDILSITVFNDSSNNNSSSVVFNTVTKLDKALIVNFPLQIVTKFRIILNQSIYRRGQLAPNKYEVTYRDFYNETKTKKQEVLEFTGKSSLRNKKAFKRILLKSLKKSDLNINIFKAEIPQLDFDPAFGPLTIDSIVKGSDFNVQNRMWNGHSKVNSTFRKMIDEKVLPTRADLRQDRSISNSDRLFLIRNSPLQMSLISGAGRNTDNVVMPVQQPLDYKVVAYPYIQEQNHLDYQYTIGLRNIKIGLSSQKNRGVFISKQVPCPSDSGEVKIKVKDVNYELADIQRDSTVITSIEYSVCNKALPSVEEDWRPILPINQEYVEAERLFINEVGLGYLRFPASVDNVFEIYKNGYRINIDDVSKGFSINSDYITYVQLPFGSFDQSDIFTITYKPFDETSIVRFSYNETNQGNLGSAFDDSGAGETFNNTVNNQMVTLKNEPYIDYAQVEESGGYSTTVGFTGTYQPITILLSDGTYALNQTNYRGLSQNVLSDFDETDTVFLQSGRNIIFNKPITEPFTVYYQYLPSNLRFRIVLRVNDTNYISPYVDMIHLKTKTRKADSRRVI